MKTIKIPQTIFINGEDGYDSAAEFNQKMMELAHLNPRFERDGKSFWIFYSIIIEEPETIAEQHEMQGEKAHCSDCPYFMRKLNRFGNIDGREKRGTCGLTGIREHMDSAACDEYYSLPKGERRRF